MDLPREYVRLGLRFNRLEDGLVDAYTGDPDLRREVESEPPPRPAELAGRARELSAELPSAGLPPDRTAFLAAQLLALECGARRLAGEPVSYLDEVEAYYQVRPRPGDTDEYARAHERLDALLPGGGGLPERYAAYREGGRCPPDKLVAAVAALSEALRERVRTGLGLPAGESVEYRLVTGRPWSGFTHYLGRYRSAISLNTDVPPRLAYLPHLLAHEAYPGHHTEHCRKEAGLVGRQGRAEHTVFLVNTPECLVAEGLADLGLSVVVGQGWGRWVEEVLAAVGLRFEGELAEQVSTVAVGLERVRQDAALMLHDRGRGEDEVVAYLCRWMLVSERHAREAVRFVADPLWRAYTTTYVEGYRLLAGWLDARPAGQARHARFARLLDEPLTPAGIAADLAEPPDRVDRADRADRAELPDAAVSPVVSAVPDVPAAAGEPATAAVTRPAATRAGAV